MSKIDFLLISRRIFYIDRMFSVLCVELVTVQDYRSFLCRLGKSILWESGWDFDVIFLYVGDMTFYMAEKSPVHHVRGMES